MKRIAFHTLGCKVNIYETEAMQELMREAGYRIVDFSDMADVYIINTCTVTNTADRKSRQLLHRVRRDNPDALIVAVGCYVQSAMEKLKQDNSVDIIIGNNMKKDVASIISAYFRNQEVEKAAQNNAFVLDIGSIKEYENIKHYAGGEHTRAFIKIQDGCNQFCSYCIIPYTRGRVRSRKLSDILDEVKMLEAKGYKELVLTGIHLSSYGVDFGKDIELIDVIEAVSQSDGIKRLRIGSLEPRIISNHFLSRLAQLESFCPHFHLSLQSGCDRTLTAMNRQYTSREFMEGVELIRRYFDNPAITTDIIVGFPDESEDDFKQSMEFIDGVGFSEVHIFPYSKREHTKAAAMNKQVSGDIKRDRLARLQDACNVHSLSFIASWLGREVEVLAESDIIEHNGLPYRIGYTREYVKVGMDARRVDRNQVVKGRIGSAVKTDRGVFCILLHD